MAINHVYYGNTELINLENDTVTAADVCNQKTFHLRDGTRARGTNSYDADTSDATATVNDILLGKTAYVNGNKITGNVLDYTTFKTYFIDAYTSKVKLSSNAHELTLPVPPSTCNFGSRPIRWISIDASIGTQTTSSTSAQNEYIVSATYSYDELLLVSTVDVIFKAVTVRVGKTNSTTAAVYTQIYGPSYFNFISFDKLAEGQAKIQINTSKMAKGYFKSGVDYYITIGG